MIEENPPFKDHFSAHAGEYAAFRPTYPNALFEWLAQASPGRSMAWDCATGSGQAALGLSGYFDRVIASDASSQQIGQGSEHPLISYRVESAEKSSLQPESADLITVAQAYHWFDHDQFLGEADRVLRPAGLLAIWAYPLAKTDSEVDAVIHKLYETKLGSYWPAERVYIDRGYQDFTMPWPEISSPDFTMTANWRLPELLGYLGTWSALRRFVAERGFDPLVEVSGPLGRAWGDPEQARTVRWPLILKVCRKPG